MTARSLDPFDSKAITGPIAGRQVEFKFISAFAVNASSVVHEDGGVHGRLLVDLPALGDRLSPFELNLLTLPPADLHNTGFLLFCPFIEMPEGFDLPFSPKTLLPAAWLHRETDSFGSIEEFGSRLLPFHVIDQDCVTPSGHFKQEDYGRVYATGGDRNSLLRLLAEFYTALANVVSRIIDPTDPRANSQRTLEAFAEHALDVHHHLEADDFHAYWNGESSTSA